MEQKKETQMVWLNPWSVEDLYFYYEGDNEEDEVIHQWIQDHEQEILDFSKRNVISLWHAFRHLYFGDSYVSHEGTEYDVDGRSALHRTPLEEEALSHLLALCLKELQQEVEVSDEER